MINSDLLDLDTWVQVKNSAPKVTVVPFDAAQAGVKALARYAEGNRPNADLDGRKYWEASLKTLVEVGELSAAPKALGRACRSIGLTLWRMADGYHVAWSEEQLAILMEYFKI